MAIFSDIVWEGGFFGTFHSARLGRNALAWLVHSTPSHMVRSTPSHVVHSTPLRVAFLIRHKWLSKSALSTPYSGNKCTVHDKMKCTGHITLKYTTVSLSNVPPVSLSIVPPQLGHFRLNHSYFCD